MDWPTAGAVRILVVDQLGEAREGRAAHGAPPARRPLEHGQDHAGEDGEEDQDQAAVGEGRDARHVQLEAAHDSSPAVRAASMAAMEKR